MEKTKQDAESESATRFLRVKDVQRLTTLSRSTLWKLEREGKFPKGHTLPALPAAKVWLESDVLRWMREQIDPSSRSGR